MQRSDLNLFKSKLQGKFGQVLPKQALRDPQMQGMAQKISRKLSQLRSAFLFKASQARTQSKINFKRKKTEAPAQPDPRAGERNADQSSRIYSAKSVSEDQTEHSLRAQHKLKTNEILAEMEGLEESPKALGETREAPSKRTGKVFFGRVSAFSAMHLQPSKKLEPVVLSEEPGDSFGR